ncbi:carnitine O-palmitoyltransferase 2, mitochondrial-like isoform X1 [Hydractinia symbiolongicarpus]|uniref:carnitine O-palmitoyltransferase 2, mitochondrial-like isoform X1 n=1 Tax=Hydractinia symbiolongicarpus TaxID=13093 RepID=UPI00254B70F0|nr:carnitine O-palmitoyltransferase 2, mitochondrial-like isoform X1 [Hydractinia symbiolongicarpus]
MFNVAKSQRCWRKYGHVLKIAPSISSFSTSSRHKNDSEYLQNSLVPTMHFQKSLPRLAIPKLEDTSQRYLMAQKPLLTPDQYNKTKTITDNFLGYEGRALHAELVEQDKSMRHTSYISAPWFDMYLKYRDSIVLNHNPFILTTDDPNTTDQITRATKLIHAALRFKKSLDAGNLEPDVYHLNPKKSDTQLFRRLARMTPSSLSWYMAYLFKAFPLDMSQYEHLFNSTRIPKQEKDELKKVEGGREILVIRNGNIFLFDAIKKDGSLVSRDDIHANLSAILKASNNKVEHPLAILTAEKRNTWAQLRQHLETDPKNAELIHRLDSALFMVGLDDRDCLDEYDATEMFLYGDGSSRWFDKSFHMAISKNAKMAINFEHAWGDGVAVVRFLNETVQASSSDTYTPNENADALLTVQKLDFDLDNKMKTAIEKSQEEFNQRVKTLTINAIRMEEYGKNYLKTKKLSPDAVMQLAFQIAYYRQHGKHAATYESCSTAAFKHGRTETLRPCTVATVACAEAFEPNHSASVEEMQALLSNTSKMHGQLTKEAAMGQGFDRHLFALKYLAEKSGKEVEFFADEAYKNINHIIISTSTVFSPHIQMGGFAPVVPNGLGVGYMVHDEWLGCNTSTYTDSPNGSEFVSLVQQSLSDIKKVLDGKNFKY